MVQTAPDSPVSAVAPTNLDYAQYSFAPKRSVGMESDTSPIVERGVVTLSDEAWAQARHRTEIIGPLATLEVVGHEAADAAAQALGLSRRQVYVLIRRARQGTGLVTDLAPGRSGGGKGKGRLSEPVERIIRELLQKRFLTKQKRVSPRGRTGVQSATAAGACAEYRGPTDRRP